MGMRNGYPTEVLRVEVVINQNLAGRRFAYGLAHVVNALQTIEIDATDDVCSGYQLVGFVGVFVVAQNLLGTIHPTEEIGECIRDYDADVLVLAFKEMG